MSAILRETLAAYAEDLPIHGGTEKYQCGKCASCLASVRCDEFRQETGRLPCQVVAGIITDWLAEREDGK